MWRVGPVGHDLLVMVSVRVYRSTRSESIGLLGQGL